MREIKFRVWNKDENKMYPVSRLEFGDDGAALTVVAVIPGDYYCGLVIGENGVLMQYIGIKDNKRTAEYPQGQNIFKDDIIELYLEGVGWQRFKMVWNWHNARFQLEELIDHSWWSFDDTSEIRVIGNIYENPELLKAGE